MKRVELLLIMLVASLWGLAAEQSLTADFTGRKLPNLSWVNENTAYVTDRYGASSPSLQIKSEGYLQTEKLSNIKSISFKTTRSSNGKILRVEYSTNLSDFTTIAEYDNTQIAQWNSANGMQEVVISDLSNVDTSAGGFIRFYSTKSSYYIDDIVITYDDGVTSVLVPPIISASPADENSGLTDENLFYGKINVTITPSQDDVTTYYRLNDGETTEYSYPFEVSADTFVESWSVDVAGNDSQHVTAEYKQMQTEAPTFIPDEGSYDTDNLIVMLVATENATIEYSFNNSAEEWYLYEASGIEIVGTVTIYARASLAGYKQSDVVSATYTYRPAGVERHFRLVTSQEDISIGGNYLIVSAGEAGEAYAMGVAQDKNNRKGVAVTIDGNCEIATSDTELGVFQLHSGYSENTYSLYDEANNGYLYAASSSSNYLRTTDGLSANSSCTMTHLTDNSVNIYFVGDYTHNWMRWNSSSSLFSCYSDGQKSIYLYKEVSQVVLPEPVISVVDGIVDESNRFVETLTVSIDCALSGAKLQYRFGDADEWVDYVAPLTITETTILCAKSSYGGESKEVSVEFALINTDVASIAEFKEKGVNYEVLLIGDQLTTTDFALRFTSPLYVIAQEGERMFVTDRHDNSGSYMIVELSGNADNGKRYSRGEIIPAGLKGYYVRRNPNVPKLFINQFDETQPSYSADAQCVVPDVSGTVSLSPVDIGIEGVLQMVAQSDYSQVAKLICLPYVWVDLDAMQLSLPIDRETVEQPASNRELGAGDAVLPLCNLFGISLPSVGGVQSVVGVLDYSSEANEVLRFDVLSFGIATGIDDVISSDSKVYVKNGNIVAPEGAKIYDMNGVYVKSDDLLPGLYIVVVEGEAVRVLVK